MAFSEVPFSLSMFFVHFDLAIWLVALQMPLLAIHEGHVDMLH